MKNHKWTIFYSLALFAFTLYVTLDSFVLSAAYQTNATVMNLSLFEEEGAVDPATAARNESADAQTAEGLAAVAEASALSSASTTAAAVEEAPAATLSGSTQEGTLLGSYEADGIRILLREYEVEDTAVYVAEVLLSSAQYLKTAFAQDTYGKNVTATTSEMALSSGAVLAVNGDYYGARDKGYVIRNGIVYRDSADSEDVLCIYADGRLEVVDPASVSAQELADAGVWQAFSFGPGLLEDGEITVSVSDEVGRAKASNPRTAIAMIDPLHYLFVVSDGRTSESEGLSLYELAGFLKSLGAKTAYNLDGGGSSAMVFQGQLINHPTTSGKTIKERSVSDIVYIG